MKKYHIRNEQLNESIGPLNAEIELKEAKANRVLY